MRLPVLCVDDDQAQLAAYRRFLDAEFGVETALGAGAALAILAERGPFATVVSDLHMPGMDGIRLLTAVRENYPNTVRVLLTGAPDLEHAIQAVNDGHIFRFLTKPCGPMALLAAVHAAVDQYRLVIAERELLDQTLRSSIGVLGEVLAIANPDAFGRGERVRQIVRNMANALNGTVEWEVEVAATLSQLGCIAVPERILAASDRGAVLRPEDQQLLESRSIVASKLLRPIPRLDVVAEIVAYQDKRFDGSNLPALTHTRQDIPFGARLLKIALDFDALVGRSLSEAEALTIMLAHPGWYDPEILAALGGVVQPPGRPPERREIPAGRLECGMVTADDVYDDAGRLLLRKGHSIGPAMIERIQNFGLNGRMSALIAVMVSSVTDPVD